MLLFKKLYIAPPVLSVIDVVTQWTEEYVRNSYLSAIKRAKNEEPQWTGGEAFNVFGVELHRRYLQPREEPNILSLDEEVMIMGMVSKLKRNKELQKIWNNSEKEVNVFSTVEGVWCRITGDMLQRNIRFKHGEDLKSTSCKTQREFELACRKYGYFRQGEFYKAVAKLNSFTFRGIEKTSVNPNIYTVNIEDYHLWRKDGILEYKELLNLHKRYAKRNNGR